MKSISKVLRRLLLTIFIVAAVAAGFQYLYCPVYNFPKPKAFSGDKIYNPYQGMDSTAWKKANFHLHTAKWAGLTNGRNTSDQMADSIYRFLKYDIIGLSDYQQINYYREKKIGFIPMYEHGYLMPKNHQIVLGSNHVTWLDYPFPQTLSNKQHVIETLKEDSSNVVAIAHPRMRNSYPPGDFKFLSGYDCIEIFDRIIYSVPAWDTALSTGHPAFATSVDDNHDINDLDEVGINFTLVNAPVLSQPSVLGALKRGSMIACEMNFQRQNNYVQKREACDTLPVIKSIVLENNQLRIISNTVMSYLYFFGQGGKVMKKVTETTEAVYDFAAEDTYIRTDIHYPDSTIYHLNPFFRYSDEGSIRTPVSINKTKTILFRILFFIIFGASVIIYFKRFKRRKAVH